MNKDNIVFIGMDVSKEVEYMTEQLLCKKECTGMNDGQLAAYNMGIKNTLAVLKATIEGYRNNEIVVNINGLNNIEEFDVDDLLKMLTE